MTPMGICLAIALTGRFAGAVELSGGRSIAGQTGGDEFIVLAAHTSQAALEAVASRILTRLRQPFRIGLIEVYTGCAIGISLAPGTDRTAKVSFALPTPQCITPKKAAAVSSAFFAGNESARI